MLLGSSDFRNRLSTAVQRAESTLLIASAFTKVEALKKLLSSIGKNVTVVVVSRWQKHDLLTGASDLEVYNFCKEAGWDFGISLNFHGKLYVVDKSNIFLGSANCTLRGLNLTDVCNIEYGTVIPVESADLQKIDQFLREEIVWLNDHVFGLIEREISDSRDNAVGFLSSAKWSSFLRSELVTEVRFLWVGELLFGSPEQILNVEFDNQEKLHDFELLGLDLDCVDSTELERQFRKTRLYQWVIYQLNEHKEMRFGSVSAQLHNSLLDDPVPYRKEVKEFVSVLFGWLQYLDHEFSVVQHSRTVSVKLA